MATILAILFLNVPIKPSHSLCATQAVGYSILARGIINKMIAEASAAKVENK